MKHGVLVALLVAASCGSEQAPPPEEIPPAPATSPGEARLSRLTAVQYRNTVRDLFGDELVVPPELEPDAAVDGLLAIGAAHTSISPRGVEQYEAAAYDIARQVMEPGPMRDALVPCTPAATVDRACARDVLEPLGLRAWRRPLSPDELSVVLDLADTAAAELDDFYDGVEFGVAALLQSPEFLFRVELGEPDPADPELRRYTDYEMASRLSYLLWNTTPDDELLAAAAAGELTTDAGLRAHAERLLASPRARLAVRNLFSDVFGLYLLDDLTKDPTQFVHISAEVGPAAREETLRLIEHLVFDEQADFRDLLTTRTTFLDRKLASIYEVPAPTRDGFGRYEWPADSPRAGMLTHISVLALYSHNTASSATLRGRFVRKSLLCGQILPPPTELNTALPEPSGTARTLKERVAEHLQSDICASCHDLMDPIGLGLENFDALGRHRLTDHDVMIDPTGELDGTYFADAVDLGRVVREHPELGRCMARNAYRYATGRTTGSGESELIDYLSERFAADDYRVLDLLLHVVMSPGFRTATPPAETDEGGAR